jgi:cytochrome c oxidase assembly protein subunit 15
MVMLGGATRLMHAGLSIVEWRPLTGILPPLTQAGWLQEFTKYQAYPEFQQRHSWMTLTDFQFIYFMEYTHRLVGRLIGLWFVVPLVIFWRRGWLTYQIKRRSLIALGVGALQGAMGWYMVKSGLSKDPQVSPYRLTAHLLLAVWLYSLLLWTAFQYLWPQVQQRKEKLHVWAMVSCGGILLTLSYGGLVAGLKAGFIYNTFPLMNGQWLPEDWCFLHPLTRNFFENPATVQFIHRWLGIATLVIIIGTVRQAIRQQSRLLQRSGILLGVIGIVQVILGVATLLLQVPPVLGILHQGTAILLFSAALSVIYLSLNQDQALFPKGA